MSWRTVVLTNRAKVEYSMGYMVIREKEVHRVFMDEIGTILVATPAAAFTGVWVSECLKRKICLGLCCGTRKVSPLAMLRTRYKKLTVFTVSLLSF